MPFLISYSQSVRFIRVAIGRVGRKRNRFTRNRNALVCRYGAMIGRASYGVCRLEHSIDCDVRFRHRKGAVVSHRNVLIVGILHRYRFEPPAFICRERHVDNRTAAACRRSDRYRALTIDAL